jgi:hypothetical protein
VLDDVIRDASEERTDASESACAEHDELDVEFAGFVEDRVRHIAVVRHPNRRGFETMVLGELRPMLGEFSRLVFIPFINCRRIARDRWNRAAEPCGMQRRYQDRLPDGDHDGLDVGVGKRLPAAAIAASALLEPSYAIRIFMDILLRGCLDW